MAESRPLLGWLRSCPVTLLLGAAVLVWLAGALLTSLADTTSSPAVITVASVDGSPDDQSSGGGPKSAGASQPRDSDSGSGSAAGHPVSSQASKPTDGDSQPASGQPHSAPAQAAPHDDTAAKPPAPHQEAPQAGNDESANRDAAAKAPPVDATPAAGEQAAPAAPRPEARPAADTNNGATTPRPAGPRTRPDASPDATQSAPRTGPRVELTAHDTTGSVRAANRPDQPGSGCGPGAGSCSNTPAPAVPAPPAPTGPSNATGAGTPGGAHAGGGPAAVAPGQNPEQAQLAQLAAAPARPDLTTPDQTTAPGRAPPAPPIQTTTLPGLAPLTTTRALPATAQTQDGQVVPAAVAPRLDDHQCIMGTPGCGSANFQPIQPMNGHEFLDDASWAPIIGSATSLANGAWHAIEGNWTEAGIDAAGVIPYGGKLIKMGRDIKAAGKIPGLLKRLNPWSKGADEAADAAKAAPAPKPDTPEPQGTPPPPADKAPAKPDTPEPGPEGAKPPPTNTPKAADQAPEAGPAQPGKPKPNEAPIVPSEVGKTISPQKQARHVEGSPLHGEGSYFKSPKEAQDVLDAFHNGSAEVLGRSDAGHIVVRYRGVTGFNNNPRNGFMDQPTNVFLIKGTKSPSVVPYNPIWSPGAPR